MHNNFYLFKSYYWKCSIILLFQKWLFFPGYPALLVYKHLLCLPSTDLGTLGLHHLTPCLQCVSIYLLFFIFPATASRELFLVINISLLDSMGSFYFPFVNISATIFLNTLQTLVQNFTLFWASFLSKYHICVSNSKFYPFFKDCWNVNIMINIILIKKHWLKLIC